MQGGKRLAANGVNTETEYPNIDTLIPQILPLYPRAGRWYRCGLHIQWAHALASINKLITAPLCFSRDTTITDIGIAVEAAAAAGGVARLGIYTNSANGTVYPDKLIVDSGEIVTSTTGFKIITLANPITLPAGTIVWLVSLFGVASPNCWYGSTQQNTFGADNPKA